MINVANVFSYIANGAGKASSSSSSGSDGFIAWLVKALLKIANWIWGIFATLFFKLSQFLLRIVEFFQFFAGRLTGIDTWNTKSDVGRVSLSDSDVIFRFLLSKSVRTAFYALLGLSILLLIVFTIIAIVRSDYQAATDAEGKADGSYLPTLKKAGKSLFLMLIIPVILLFGILGSNAVLASLSNALKGDSNVSLGGSVFTAAAYEANYYRKYAEGGERVPVDFGTELLQNVYNPNKGEDALGGMVTVGDETYFVAPMGTKKLSRESSVYVVYNSFINAYVCDLYAKYNDSTIGSVKAALISQGAIEGNTDEEKQANAARYISRNTINAKDNSGNRYVSVGYAVFARSFTSIFIIGNKGTTNVEYYLKTESGDPVRGTRQSDSDTSGLTGGIAKSFGGLQTYVIPELTVGGKVKEWSNVNDVPVTTYSLGYMSWLGNGSSNIIKGVYNSWVYNSRAVDRIKSKLKNYVGYAFEKTYTINNDVLNGVTNISGGNLAGTPNVFTRSNEFYYDGNLVTLADEYYVMADFVDWAIEHRTEFYVVNSSNPLIKWSGVNGKYIGYNGENGKGGEYLNTEGTSLGKVDGFVVQYSSGNSRYYVCAGTDKTTEIEGETFILCTKSGEKYLPITMANSSFSSSYLAKNYAGPIVARGIFDDSANPTFITNTDANVGEVAYFGIIPTKNEESAIYYGYEEKSQEGETYNAMTKQEDCIDGSDDDYQWAEGKIIPYNSKGTKLSGEISFNYVKVDDVSVKDGVQYITLHFYNKTGNNYKYLFTANVIGTKNSEGKFESDLFAESTIITIGGSSYPTIALRPEENAYSYAWSVAERKSLGEMVACHTIRPYSNNENDMLFTKLGLTSAGTAELEGEISYGTAIEETTKYVKLGASNSSIEKTYYYYYNTAYNFELPADGETKFYDADLVFSRYLGSSLKNQYRVDGFYITRTEDGSKYILEFYSGLVKKLTMTMSAYNGENPKTAIEVIYDIFYSDSELDGGNVVLWGIVKNTAVVNVKNDLTKFNLQRTDVFRSGVKYIYFERGDVSRSIGFDFAIGLNGIASIFDKNEQSDFFYFRFKLGFIYYADGDTIYNLTNGSAVIDYNFDARTGITFDRLYNMGDINFIILLFASILLISVIGQAIWGLIKRIYDVVLLSLMYPAICSTLPLGDDRFKKWSSKLTSAVLGTYGIVLGIDLFFVLLPVVREATEIFRQEDIPAALQSSALFGSADFLNRVVYLMFMLVLFTLIRTLPSFVSGIVGGDDVYKSGADVKKSVKENIATVGNVVSGKAVMDTGKKLAGAAGSFIPGGAFIAPIAKKAKDSIKNKVSDNLKRKAEAAAGVKRGAESNDKLKQEQEELERLKKGAAAPNAEGENKGTEQNKPEQEQKQAQNADTSKAAEQAAGSEQAEEAKEANGAEIAGEAKQADGLSNAGIGNIQQIIDQVLRDRERLGEKAGAGKKGTKVELDEETVKKYNEQLQASGIKVDAKGRFHDLDGKMLSDSKVNSMASDRADQMLDQKISGVGKQAEEATALAKAADQKAQGADQKAQAVEQKAQEANVRAQEAKVSAQETKAKMAEKGLGFESSKEYLDKIKKDPNKQAEIKSKQYAATHEDPNVAQKVLSFFGGASLVAAFKSHGVERHTKKYYNKAAKQNNKLFRMKNDPDFKRKMERRQTVGKVFKTTGKVALGILRPIKTVKTAINNRIVKTEQQMKQQLNAANQKTLEMAKALASKKGNEAIVKGLDSRMRAAMGKVTAEEGKLQRKVQKLDQSLERAKQTNNQSQIKKIEDKLADNVKKWTSVINQMSKYKKVDKELTQLKSEISKGNLTTMDKLSELNRKINKIDGLEKKVEDNYEGDEE